MYTKKIGNKYIEVECLGEEQISDYYKEQIIEELINSLNNNDNMQFELEMKLRKDTNRLYEVLNRVNEKYNVNVKNDIKSHRKICGRFIIGIKKVIRKSMNWYIEPIIQQQNEVNANLIEVLNETLQYIEELDFKLEQLSIEKSEQK